MRKLIFGVLLLLTAGTSVAVGSDVSESAKDGSDLRFSKPVTTGAGFIQGYVCFLTLKRERAACLPLLDNAFFRGYIPTGKFIFGLYLALAARNDSLKLDGVSGSEGYCAGNGAAAETDESSPANYENAVRKNCRIGDIIIGSIAPSAVLLCETSKPVISVGPAQFLCYLGPKREVHE